MHDAGPGRPGANSVVEEPAVDIDVVVETPQGSRNKYVVDPKSGRMRLDRMLFTSTVYPLDYGFGGRPRAGGPDAKVLTVCSHDPRKAGIRDLGDVPAHLLAEISHFFDIYKELEPGKSTDIRGWQDRA